MTPADLEAALKSDPILNSHRQSNWNLFDQFVAACSFLKRGQRLAKPRKSSNSSEIGFFASEDAGFTILRVAVLAAARHLGIDYTWTEPGCCLAHIAIKPPAKVYPPMAPLPKPRTEAEFDNLVVNLVPGWWIGQSDFVIREMTPGWRVKTHIAT